MRRGTEGREGSRDTRGFGHNLTLNPKESFVLLWVLQFRSASRNTTKQAYDLLL